MLEVGDRYVLPGLTGALHSSVHQLKHRSFAERVEMVRERVACLEE
ncbi:MAG: hypothetical protein M3120_01470 [Pseudomonadota bacterium]|nr:hypothetical protein [Pseudomonadota bacterium]